MPIKTIQFDHNGQNVHAELFYNFNNFSNAVLVTLLNKAEGLNENILLLKGKGKNGWRFPSILKSRFPSTANNIINCVDKELENEMSLDHIFVLSNLVS
jgi:hypothetical protein